MRRIVCGIIAIALLFSGCSSDDNLTPIAATPPTTNPTIPDNVFFTQFNYDHTPVLDGLHYPTWNPLRGVQKHGHQYTLELSAELGYKRFRLTFTKYGDIVGVDSENIHGIPGILTHHNYKYMAQDHFQFELVELNETAGTVRGNFSGKLYVDNDDLNSDFIEVSGSFYNLISSQGSGVYTYLEAKLNGTNWHNTHEPNFSEVPYADYNNLPSGLGIYQATGDDQYRIIIAYEKVVGVRNFSDTTSGTYVRLSKYNVTTGLYEDYNTTGGTIVISTKNPIAPNVSEYVGVFNFTAVNPNNNADVIQVTDGQFYFLGNT